MSTLTLPGIETARRVVHCMTTSTRATMFAMFALTGIALAVELIVSPWGAVQAGVILLPVLTGLAVAMTRSFYRGERGYTVFTFTALVSAVGSVVVFTWCAVDAATTGLQGWVLMIEDTSTFNWWPAVTAAYAVMALVAALAVFTLAKAYRQLYRLTRPVAATKA